MTPTQRAAAERLADAADDVGVKHFDSDDMPPEVVEMQKAAALLRELLAEPVQEPVAYIDQRQLAAGYVTLLCITRPEYRSYADVAEGIHYTPVYLHPPQQPMHCPKDGGECGAGGYCRPEPVQRRPLTDKDIVALLAWDDYMGGCITLLDFARAIERAITGEPT